MTERRETGEAPERKGVEHRGRRVEKEVRVAASPERVWRALADPARLAEWFVDRAEGPVEDGGTYTWFWDKAGFEVPNRVVIAEPPSRLELETAMPWGGARVLEVRISVAGGGETHVRLVDSGFREGADWDEEYEGVDSGWEMALAMMKHYVERHFGEPRTELMVERPARFEHAELPSHFSTTEGLARWLTRSGAPAAVGEPIRLELWDGRPLTGRVLARTAYEISFSWDEMDAALEVKPFGHRPGERVVMLRLAGWSMGEDRRAELEGWLEATTERLADAVSAGSSRG